MAREDKSGNDQKLVQNPFAALKDKVGELPKGPEPKPEPVKEKSGPARAVVRYERKGHGGKEVTIVDGMLLSDRELEKWLKELKQKLGCGGAVVEHKLMLQGDQRPRIEKLLTDKGVKKVSVG